MSPLAIGVPWTVSDALTALSLRLDDEQNVHWTVAELQRYLLEGLRTLSAYTQRYRDRVAFGLSSGSPFYNLPDNFPERFYTVTAQDLILDVEHALMEPPGLTWTGTEQFSMELVLDALNRRLQQFLLETGAVQTQFSQAYSVDSGNRTPLDPSVITVRRVGWRSDINVTVPLKREDEWATFHFAPTAAVASPLDRWPTGYSVATTPPLTMRLHPAPTGAGFLDIVAILTGPVLDASGSGQTINVPDDWSWVIKWGALADLLSRDGVAYDPSRAAYCEARWQQGTTLAKAASVVLTATLGGRLLTLRSLADLDLYRRSWQRTVGPPTIVATAGHNLMAVAPIPSTSGFVTLDVVVNVPVFAEDDLTAELAVDEPLRDAYLDYCQHLALFKEGAPQIQRAMGLFERFQRACGLTTIIDAASVPNRGPILQDTVQDLRVKDREAVPEPTLP